MRRKVFQPRFPLVKRFLLHGGYFHFLYQLKIVNGNILDDAELDYKPQVITLKASMDVSASFKSVRLNRLISCTFDHEGEYILDADQPRDLRIPQEYKIMSDNGTYVMCTVNVEWFCESHNDSDGDCICDDCNEYTLTDFTIVNYNEETNVNVEENYTNNEETTNVNIEQDYTNIEENDIDIEESINKIDTIKDKINEKERSNLHEKEFRKILSE